MIYVYIVECSHIHYSYNYSYFLCVVRTYKVYFLRNFQICITVNCRHNAIQYLSSILSYNWKFVPLITFTHLPITLPTSSGKQQSTHFAYELVFIFCHFTIRWDHTVCLSLLKLLIINLNVNLLNLLFRKWGKSQLLSS